ncbi:MAG: hypothetical protein NT149_01260 [Candidatus Gottesmanbacteria bacterium]|nr:hypothetical protein [Candidatus Gottesmanbacteria bacterium]
MAMAEQKDIPKSINLEGALGLDARISGGSAFGQLTDALTARPIKNQNLLPFYKNLSTLPVPKNQSC